MGTKTIFDFLKRVFVAQPRHSVKGRNWKQALLEDPHAGIRFLTLLASSLLIIIVASHCAAKCVLGPTIDLVGERAGKANVKLEFNDKGTTLIFFGGSLQKAQFLLPASKLWADTGIVFEPGQEATLAVSGAVQLAVDNMVSSAAARSVSRYKWSGPDGIPAHESAWQTEKKKKATEAIKILPGANLGAILAYFQPNCEGTERELGAYPGTHNPRPPSRQLSIVRSGGRVRAPGRCRSNLWVTVNDLYLDPSKPVDSLVAFFGEDKSESSEAGAKLWKQWSEIERDGYWGLWYYDNVGQFLLSLDMDTAGR